MSDFNCVLEEARESDWDGIIACHQGKLSCSTWNYQRSTIGAYFLRPEGLKTDNATATVSGVFARAFPPVKLPCDCLVILAFITGSIPWKNKEHSLTFWNYSLLVLKFSSLERSWKLYIYRLIYNFITDFKI